MATATAADGVGLRQKATERAALFRTKPLRHHRKITASASVQTKQSRPAGRPAGGTANNPNNAKQAKISDPSTWSSDARWSMRIPLDWDSPRQHLAYLRDLR
jgi:hypothetical protein